MSESSLPNELPALLIPMQSRPWLVPNILVAEIIELCHPDRPGLGPEWLVGWIDWRGLSVPLICFEKLNGSGTLVIGSRARVAVMNTIGARSGFYAVLVQDIPKSMRIAANQPWRETGEGGAAESMCIRLERENAVIPDLDAVEQALAGLREEAGREPPPDIPIPI